jgi:hypothetical protein
MNTILLIHWFSYIYVDFRQDHDSNGGKCSKSSTKFVPASQLEPAKSSSGFTERVCQLEHVIVSS